MPPVNHSLDLSMNSDLMFLLFPQTVQEMDHSSTNGLTNGQVLFLDVVPQFSGTLYLNEGYFCDIFSG
jgi:hypothetical protein